MVTQSMVTMTKAAEELVLGDRVMVGMGHRRQWNMVPAVVISTTIYGINHNGVSIELATDTDHFWLSRNVGERLEIA